MKGRKTDDEPDFIWSRGVQYIRTDLVAHHVAGGFRSERDSRSKPVRAETVEQGSVHESDGGEANRPENPAYFWLGIQAEGRE